MRLLQPFRAFATIQGVLVAACLLLAPEVHAQVASRVRVLCPEAALNVPLYQKVLVERVKQSIDPELFRVVRVRVVLRRVGGDSTLQTNSIEDVLSGLTLSNQGLTFLAGGALSYDLRCSHSYIARIRVVATELSSGARLVSATDSRITINSSGEASLPRTITGRR